MPKIVLANHLYSVQVSVQLTISHLFSRFARFLTSWHLALRARCSDGQKKHLHLYSMSDGETTKFAKFISVEIDRLMLDRGSILDSHLGGDLGGGESVEEVGEQAKRRNM